MRLKYLLVLCFSLSGCVKHRPPEVFEFPKDFRGCAVIVYGVTNYPQIPMKDGKLIERFPTNGIIITSSINYDGVAKDESYFYDTNGQLVSIPQSIFSENVGEMSQDGKQKLDFEQIFIGTEAELGPKLREPQKIEKLWGMGYRSQN
ncbi:MAG: hypothetical protein ABR955_13550 [Verrucomicrobiota bacterium]|jgi:hypothetical protein